jgi:hypothetical protein
MSRLVGLGVASQFGRRGRGQPLPPDIYVDYTPSDTVSNIEPNTVTWIDNKFLVPEGVEEFSFEDDGQTWMFSLEDEVWNLYEWIDYALP